MDTHLDWIDAGAVAALPARRGRVVFVRGMALAAFRIGDAVHVLDDRCPHAGASLAGGALQDGVVRCPAHGLRFEVATGCLRGGSLAVRCHPTRVEHGRLLVGVAAMPGAVSAGCAATPP